VKHPLPLSETFRARKSRHGNLWSSGIDMCRSFPPPIFSLRRIEDYIFLLQLEDRTPPPFFVGGNAGEDGTRMRYFSSFFRREQASAAPLPNDRLEGHTLLPFFVERDFPLLPLRVFPSAARGVTVPLHPLSLPHNDSPPTSRKAGACL